MAIADRVETLVICHPGLTEAEIAAASLHHVHHALPSQIPENIPAHVLDEMAAGALGGVIVFAVVSTVCNRIKAHP